LLLRGRRIGAQPQVPGRLSVSKHTPLNTSIRPHVRVALQREIGGYGQDAPVHWRGVFNFGPISMQFGFQRWFSFAAETPVGADADPGESGACAALHAGRAVGALDPAFDIVGEVFLQEQLDQLCALFVDLDDFRAHTIVAEVDHLNRALQGFVGEKITFEVQCLPDNQGPGTHDQHAAVAHVLHNAREALGTRFQSAPAGDPNS
jgi:hypothetical protein